MDTSCVKEDRMRRATWVGLCVVLVCAGGLAIADSPAEKAIRDQAGNPGGYTDGKVDRAGGDNCADAPTIGAAVYSDSGDTTGYVDDWGPIVSGFGQDGEDQAYEIIITTAGTIDVTVTPDDQGFDLSSYIIGDADCAIYDATVLAGADDGFSGDPETYSYAAAAGTYYIIVDSYIPGEVGPFTIDVGSNVPVELSKISVE
jgi:hypothetical protein